MRHRNVIGPQVRRLRDKRGWSQERLAIKLQLAGLDISRSSLSKIESGEQAVFDFQVLYFRRVFKADSDDLYRPFRSSNAGLSSKGGKIHGNQVVSIGTLLPRIFRVFENGA